MLVRVDPHRPAPETVALAVQRLDRGEVIAAPSDTVYGFLARPDRAAAGERLREWKGRSGPFLQLVAGWEQARALAPSAPDDLWDRLGRVWPGPVTVVLPAGPEAPEATVAVRMPDLPFLRAVLDATGPLWSTSANRAGEPPPRSAEAVVRAFGDVLLVLDGGPAPTAEPSTLVDGTVRPPRVLRSGCGDPAPLLDPDHSPP